MGAAGASYDKGLIGVIADPFGGALCLFLVGFFFVRLFRRLRLLTFIDFFENRYGKTAATIAAIGSIASNIDPPSDWLAVSIQSRNVGFPAS